MTVWDFLMQFDPVALILAAGILLYSAIQLIKAGLVKIPWINYPKEKEKDHEDCPLNGERLADRREAFHIGEQVGLSPAALVRNQMIGAEATLDMVDSIFEKRFLTLKKQQNQGDVVGIINDAETVVYNYFIKKTMQVVKSRIREFFQENHLAEMTQEQFENKRKQRIQQIMDLISDELNDYYRIFFDGVILKIPREEIYDWNQGIFPELIEKFQDMFSNGRQLSIENRERIDKLVKEVTDV